MMIDRHGHSEPQEEDRHLWEDRVGEINGELSDMSCHG